MVLFRHLALLLPVCRSEGRLGLPCRVLRLLSCFQFVTLHVFNLFSHSAFYLVSEDYTVLSQGKGLLLHPALFPMTRPHPPPQLLVWCQAADGCSVNGEERKGSVPNGDSHAIFHGAHQLASACPMSAEVVLATFNIVFSLKITPTAPTPSPWILGSTEICFLKSIFSLWLASCFFFEVVVGVGAFPKHIIPLETSEGRDVPGGPVVKTPCFHCRGHGFDPWSGN